MSVLRCRSLLPRCVLDYKLMNIQIRFVLFNFASRDNKTFTFAHTMLLKLISIIGKLKLQLNKFINYRVFIIEKNSNLSECFWPNLR